MTTAAMTEAELIDACLLDDRLAQKELYDRYARAMYTAAYRITADFELANDVLQEAFLKVFRHLNGFRRESTLGAWIKTIVVRTALSRVRREIRMESLEDHHQQDLIIDWGHHLDADYLEKAIQVLPTGYRSVFVMIEVEGFSHQEVANMLNISVGTSKSQLFYAKKKLRQSLAKYRD
ncbi:MAG: RNA polymerase subunit sigma-24 [Bacteroidetes bacterium]|nr:MAG: RNA polymerase subunit sigma-24 [Bacteroidota bacterium]PTM14080.1 MAG: RNA polymerase subunit sigma-24 [Bacteroidota bacterium]